jgi:phosphate transport system permease protein
MATEPSNETVDFGRVSRVRGIVFENITRLASAVGVVALVVLLVYTMLDAFEPFTADGEWFLVVAATFVLPSLLAAGYCWRRRTVGRTALRGIGIIVASTTLAATLVLWLGGQLAMVLLVTAVLPTASYLAYLRGRRRGLTVGVQTVGIIAGGGGLSSVLALFVGTQGALVAAVTVGVPAALMTRYFLSNPAIGRRAMTGTGAASLGALLAFVATELGTEFLSVSVGDAGVAVYALGAILGVAATAVVGWTSDRTGLVGLVAPVVLTAGSLVGYLFHSTYVILTAVAPMLYAITAVVPALAFAYIVYTDYDEGQSGLVLPVIPAVGIAAGLLFHQRFIVHAPNTLIAFGLSLMAAYGGYAAYVRTRENGGVAGLAIPVVIAGGLLGGLLGARELGIAGPDTWLDIHFLTTGSHYEPALTGLHPALIGSLYLMFLVAFVAFPVGVGAAIYLEEYAPENRWKRVLEVNISNLAGVPSVVYGLLGVAVFIRYGGLTLGSIIVGGFTLSLLILPIVIISSQEAIRAVPDSLRQASYGMGATRWQTVRNVVLPRALPGILTGTILALGRAVGETAPLLMVGIAAVGGVPGALTGQGTAMPLQVFSWALDANPVFRENVAAAGSMMLLIVLLAMNGLAIIIRNKYQQAQ